MARIREKDRNAIMNAIAGGVTPRQGIQHIQVGRKDETEAILKDLEQVKSGGGSVRIVSAGYGSGKALANNTGVFTERGVIEIGNITTDDRVLGTDGEFHDVIGVYPQGTKTVYQVLFNDETITECCADHLWAVQDHQAVANDPDKFDVIRTADIEKRFPLVFVNKRTGRHLPNVFVPAATINGVKQPQKTITSIRELNKQEEMTCIKVDSEDHCFVLADGTVTHNTFFLTLSKTVALKQNMMVITTDLSPDRRLYSSSGQAQNLYRAEIRSLSTPMHPDGGALEEILDAVDEKVMSNEDSEFLSEIRKLPYGFDAVTVCNKWHIANNPITEKEKRDAFTLKDACLRWFSGEVTAEGRKMLGVHSAIGDDGAWDALKLLAMLGHFAGYAGLLVELDECVNLYKINNSTSRDRNYEQILRIFNECLQGDAKYIGVIFSGTPEFVMDPRRGLFSYDALKSRLIGSEYASGSTGVDTSGPVIDLTPLSQEDLLVLLGNITNVEALGNKEDWLVDNDIMTAFLKKQYDTLGADYYKTPRELIRSWVMLLRLLRDNPDMDARQAVGAYEVKADKKESGLGAALDQAQPNNSMFTHEDADEEDFGF